MKPLAPALLAVAVLMPAFVTEAAEFDAQRLFTTGAEREAIDRARAGKTAADSAASTTPAAESEPVPPVPEVRLKGFVRRSDGPPAVWLNDDSTLGGDRVGDSLTVESGRIRGQTVLIRLPDGRSIRLKPGQRYDPDEGRVVDVLHQ